MSMIRYNNIKFRKPLEIIRKKLNEYNIIPETEILITPIYPKGWFGTVGANDRIYIFICILGEIRLEIQPVYGFSKNGSPILKGEMKWKEMFS